MSITISSESLIWFCLVLISYLAGYLYCKISFVANGGVSISAGRSIKTKNSVEKTKIQIDDKTFVTDITTDSLEKKYDNLGEIKKTSDNVTQSVNKLKNMKG